MAKKLGADETYLLKKDRLEKDVVADIHAIFGDEPNRTIDASGAQASIRLAILVSLEISLFIYNIFIYILYLIYIYLNIS